MAKDSQVRINSANRRQLQALQKRIKVKVSLSSLANEAMTLGIPHLSKNVFGATQ